MKFYQNNVVKLVFTLQESPILQNFKDLKFSMYFEVISLLLKGTVI